LCNCGFDPELPDLPGSIFDVNVLVNLPQLTRKATRFLTTTGCHHALDRNDLPPSPAHADVAAPMTTWRGLVTALRRASSPPAVGHDELRALRT
jgi:hypothetical protein